LFVSIPDALVYRLPWKRKRLQRDFTTILAVLLDAGMTETDAVSLAAESTANHSMIRRGNKMRAVLSGGTKLPDALRVMDDGRELQWRLRNVLGRRGNFVRALAGWHESLDSRAFQLEQTAAQVTTTGMVLFNGFVVAVFIIAMFLALIQIINEAVLW
jgi:type II secretory pathway component PulF